jgi:hypothetical protein
MRTALRRVGWEKRYHLALAKAQSRTFELGAWDCCIFAADIVNAITGVDPAQDYRGSKLAAFRAINAAGSLNEFASRIATEAGLVPWPVARAHRGDVVLLPGDRDFDCTVAVCVGAYAAAPGQSGLTFKPMADALACWHINHA